MEYNENNLKVALLQLPLDEPSNNLWEEIAISLEQEPLRKVIEKLPNTQPNENIWHVLESKLDISKVIKG